MKYINWVLLVALGAAAREVTWVNFNHIQQRVCFKEQKITITVKYDARAKEEARFTWSNNQFFKYINQTVCNTLIIILNCLCRLEISTAMGYCLLCLCSCGDFLASATVRARQIMNGVGDNEPNLKFLVCFISMFFRLRTCKVTQTTGRIRWVHCLETTSKPWVWDCLHTHCFKYYVERSRFFHAWWSALTDVSN